MQETSSEFTNIVRKVQLELEEIKRKEIISRYLGKPLEEYKGEPYIKKNPIVEYLEKVEESQLPEYIPIKQSTKDLSYRKEAKKKELVYNILKSNKRFDKAPEVIYRLQVRYNKIKSA